MDSDSIQTTKNVGLSQTQFLINAAATALSEAEAAVSTLFSHLDQEIDITPDDDEAWENLGRVQDARNLLRIAENVFPFDAENA